MLLYTMSEVYETEALSAVANIQKNLFRLQQSIVDTHETFFRFIRDIHAINFPTFAQRNQKKLSIVFSFLVIFADPYALF